MDNELISFIQSIENLRKGNESLLLTKSLLSSDLDAEYKLVSITNILDVVIKNQSFVLDTIKSNSELVFEQRNAIINIFEKIKD